MNLKDCKDFTIDWDLTPQIIVRGSAVDSQISDEGKKGKQGVFLILGTLYDEKTTLIFFVKGEKEDSRKYYLIDDFPSELLAAWERRTSIPDNFAGLYPIDRVLEKEIIKCMKKEKTGLPGLNKELE